MKKQNLVSSMSKEFDIVRDIEDPKEYQANLKNWLPEAMAFPAIDPDRENNLDNREDFEDFDSEEDYYSEAA